MTNADKLRALMKRYKLTKDDVAEVLSKALGEPVSALTVHSWLRPEDNRSYRNMPNAKLLLLEMQLKAGKK